MDEFIEAIYQAYEAGISFEEMRDWLDMVEREKETSNVLLDDKGSDDEN